MRRCAGVPAALISASACAALGTGLLAAALDLARLYVVRSELEACAEAAARAAARELDGTVQGIARALEVAATQAGRARLAVMLSGGAQAAFAASPAGPWRSSLEAAADCRFVKVEASAAVPLLFLPVIGAGASSRVAVTAIAAQTAPGGMPRDRSDPPRDRARLAGG